MSRSREERNLELNVRGMTCVTGAAHVSEALESVEGVLHVEVPGWSSGEAILTTDPDTSEEDLLNAVKRAGYRASVRRPAGTSPELQPVPEMPIVDRHDAPYDLVVIGTGGAGMAAAIRAAELGRRTAIIEAGILGGTCLNTGCVPSKTLMYAAKAYYHAGHHSFAGVRTRAESLDWRALISQKDQLVGGMRRNKYADVLASYGDAITLMHGRARLQPDSKIALEDDRTIAGGRVVIATGTAPRILPLEGIENVGVLTSTSAMELTEQPRSLIVIGGGAVGLELGQIFARLGTSVTVLEYMPQIVPGQEPETTEALTGYLRQEGMAIYTAVTPLSIHQETGGKLITADVEGQRREFRAEHVLMAVGRVPQTADMGLPEAGVDLDTSGFIRVNARMQTTNPRIYAAGDVTTLPKWVYLAAAAGGVAAENALGDNTKQLDATLIPEVIFTDPQIARVGLTEAQARDQDYDVKTTTLPLAYVPRALAARDTRGLIKLVAEEGSDLLLGAHVLAPEGGEIIQTAALAIRMGRQHEFTVSDLRGMLFPYLVQVEGLKLAAQTFDKDVSQLSCCAG